METFIGNLIGFAVIVFIVVRYVVPPVRRMMTARQDTVRQQLKDSEAAADRLTQSKSAHSRAVDDAESEAEKIVEDAKADAGRIVEQLQAQAKVDSERIVAQGARQTELLRVQLMRQLRLELGHESVRQATELVRDFVADAKQQSSTVDRLLDELDDMAPAKADVQYPLLAKMRSASRRALSDVSDRFKDIATDLDRKALTTVSRELVDVAKFLNDEPVVTRYLSVASEDAAPRVRLIERLMSDKVGDSTLELLRAVASQRWSANSDLVDVIEHLSRQALLEIAERDDKVGLVEDQLFQISRVLDSQPKLAILLGDSNVPAQGRADLLNKVLSSARAVNPVARALLTQTIELLRGDPAVEAIQFLIEVAVARRGEVVAQVKAAAEPSAAQRTRLTEILGRIYGHPVTLHLDIDAALLGGLLISVADEVIDGTLSSRLAAAEAQLPD